MISLERELEHTHKWAALHPHALFCVRLRAGV
jgi:hypothetical protein